MSNTSFALPRAAIDPGIAAESKANDVFDIYTIIFLALAVFIFLRLRSVLGQRTGRERPPYDPYSARDAVRTSPSEKVVTLPGRVAQPAPAAPPAGDGAERWKGIAEPGSPAATGLDAIIAADSSFDVQHFLTGARAAYEMIVTAFAQGDRRALKGLLSREVYEGFETAIREREARGERIETRFVSIDKADIAGAELRGRVAQVTIRFVSQLVSVTHDRSRAMFPRVIRIGSWSPPKPVNDRRVGMTAAGRLRLTLWFILIGCSAAMAAGNLDPLRLPDSALEPLSWSELDGWSSDDHAAA